MFLSRFHKPHRKSPEGKLAALLVRHSISTVIDVGANSGQTRDRLRAIGFSGRIVSIEPISDLQRTLDAMAERDRAWDVLPPMALGEANGTAQLLRAAADDLSSLRAPVPAFREALPTAAVIERETVTTRRLEDLWPEIDADPETTLLKIDAQGSEADILAGAGDLLPRFKAVFLEMSLRPLYEGEADYLSLCAKLHNAGFTPALFVPGYFSAAQCRLLQMDGFFVRNLRT